MSNTKELTEILRAASAIMVEVMESMEDGTYSFTEKIRALSLIPVVMKGIKGAGGLKVELSDLQQEEVDSLILEIRRSLLRSKVLSHRSSDIAADILHLAYYNVVAISGMLSRPPAAELVQ